MRIKCSTMTEAQSSETRAAFTSRQRCATGSPARVVFARLHDALRKVVGFKVLTVLKLDPATLRSVRLYSSEPSYPIGGTKQHVRSAWSEAVLDRRTAFTSRMIWRRCARPFPTAPPSRRRDAARLLRRRSSIGNAVVGTMNLWHRDGYYDDAKGLRHGAVRQRDRAGRA